LTPSILLVEDNQDDVDLVLRLFRKRGLAAAVRVARDGVEALAQLRNMAVERTNGSAPFAVVLLDLRLPRLDGFEVLEQVRRDESIELQPVVVLSSSNAPQDRRRAYALGANGYVQKPVNATELAETLALLAQYWTAVSRPPPPQCG
jgi:two-component system response regulator